MIKNYIFEREGHFTMTMFDNTVREICSELDIPTPLILDSHKKNYKHFNQAKFKKNEFVESVDFDMLALENVPEEKKKANLQT